MTGKQLGKLLTSDSHIGLKEAFEFQWNHRNYQAYIPNDTSNEYRPMLARFKKGRLTRRDQLAAVQLISWGALRLLPLSLLKESYISAKELHTALVDNRVFKGLKTPTLATAQKNFLGNEPLSSLIVSGSEVCSILTKLVESGGFEYSYGTNSKTGHGIAYCRNLRTGRLLPIFNTTTEKGLRKKGVLSSKLVLTVFKDFIGYDSEQVLKALSDLD